MKKISDVVSKNDLELRIDTEEKEYVLHLNKFSLSIMVILEEDYGIAMDQIDVLISKSPAKWTSLFVWLLLKEKDLFDNDIAKFREILGIQHLESLSLAISSAFSNSIPKNEQAVGQTKKK